MGVRRKWSVTITIRLGRRLGVEPMGGRRRASVLRIWCQRRSLPARSGMGRRGWIILGLGICRRLKGGSAARTRRYWISTRKNHNPGTFIPTAGIIRYGTRTRMVIAQSMERITTSFGVLLIL